MTGRFVPLLVTGDSSLQRAHEKYDQAIKDIIKTGMAFIFYVEISTFLLERDRMKSAKKIDVTFLEIRLIPF